MTQFCSFVWLSNIPLYYTYIPYLLYPYGCPWTFGWLPILAVVKSAAMDTGAHILWNHGFLWVQAQWWDCWVIWWYTSDFRTWKILLQWTSSMYTVFPLLLNYFLKIFRTEMTRPKTQHFSNVLPHCFLGGIWQYSVPVSCWQGWNHKARSIVAVSHGAAVIKYHRLGGLKNRNTSHGCRGWKSEITGQARLSSCESSFLGLMMVTSFLCPYTMERGGQDLPTSYKTTNPFGLGLYPMTSFNPELPKSLIYRYSCTGS